jgi:DNA-binding transcriptional MerR regulator
VTLQRYTLGVTLCHPALPTRGGTSLSAQPRAEDAVAPSRAQVIADVRMMLGDVPADLTVDELATAAGIPVRRIRFYAGKKLLPPPRLDGRTGLYGPSHLARLHLIGDLQDAGYTLSAVEDFLSAVPEDADADAVAMVATLVSPAPVGRALVFTRDELGERLGQELTEPRLQLLADASLLTRGNDGELHLTHAQLEFSLRMLAVDAPLDALVEAGLVVRSHARALAEDLQDVFHRRIMAHHQNPTPEQRERLRAVSSALRPLTIQAIVSAYQEALHDIVRESRTPD